MLVEEYNVFRSVYAARLAKPLGEYFVNQERRYVKPFRMWGNVHYVGDSWVCCHLVDTGDGLLLIDTGNTGATAMLIEAIWEAGFRPADIRWVILSHGHVDHIGGAAFLREMFGCKLYLGEPDAEMFRDHPERTYLQDSFSYADQIFTPDCVIRDGDVLTFGGTTVHCRLVPGHTAGCVALFFDATDGKTVRRAGYYGGFGFNTLTRDYLTEIGDPQLTMRQTYLQSLAKVRDEKVELFLGNHTVNNRVLEKRERQLAHPEEEPFLDPTEWGRYLDEMREACLAFSRDPHN